MDRPVSCQRRAGLALFGGPSGRLDLLVSTDLARRARGGRPGGLAVRGAAASCDVPIGGGTWPVGEAGPVVGGAAVGGGATAGGATVGGATEDAAAGGVATFGKAAGGAVVGGAVVGGALAGGAVVGGAATESAGAGAAAAGCVTARGRWLGGAWLGGEAVGGFTTRGAVRDRAGMGSAMGGAAATAAAAAISAAAVARSKLAAEEASDAGDGAPASQLVEGAPARGAAGPDGAVAAGAVADVVVAADWAGDAAAGPVWPRGSARLPSTGRRAVGGVWIALAPGERCGSELPGRGRCGSAGAWSRAGDCLAADPRAGRKPRRTCPGVSPFAPGTRRGSSDGSSCGGGRLSSAMRRTPQLQSGRPTPTQQRSTRRAAVQPKPPIWSK